MPTQKLSPQQIAAIRRSYAEGKVTQRELAAQYDICQGQVSRIVKGKSGATEPVISRVFQRILDDIRQAKTGPDSLRPTQTVSRRTSMATDAARGEGHQAISLDCQR